MNTLLTREQVYIAIDSERDYQAQKWNEKFHSIEEWAVYLDTYVHDLKVYATHTNDLSMYPKANDILRKIASLAVAALEQHGCGLR